MCNSGCNRGCSSKINAQQRGVLFVLTTPCNIPSKTGARLLAGERVHGQLPPRGQGPEQAGARDPLQCLPQAGQRRARAHGGARAARQVPPKTGEAQGLYAPVLRARTRGLALWRRALLKHMRGRSLRNSQEEVKGSSSDPKEAATPQTN
eukprot:1188284-Prorocentrum_minimum.AAC.2